MESDEVNLDVDERIAQMRTSIDDLSNRCFTNSAFQLTSELARLARRERRLLPLIRAQVDIAIQTQSLYQYRRGREVCLELIALFEDPDRARLIQANYPEQEYAQACDWWTTCAYDILAEHTAAISGCNSDGMHDCIADGLAVCRRTGRLGCVACFRMYAADVYLAADDVEMALHCMSLVASVPAGDSGSDRRWLATQSRGLLFARLGDLEAARDGLVASFELAKTQANPKWEGIVTLTELESVLWLMGEQESFSDLTREPLGGRDLPAGENHSFDANWDYRDATIACVQGDFSRAIDLVSRWDERFVRDDLMHPWFHARLRLIAAHRLAGQNDKAAELALPLRKRAAKARDWITLRQLNRLMDPNESPTPTAMLAAPRVGPFATTRTSVAVEKTAAEDGKNQEKLAEGPKEPSKGPSPFLEMYERIRDSARISEDGSNHLELLESILAIPVEQFVDPTDAARFLSLAPTLISEGAPHERAWRWAEGVAAAFPRTSFIVNRVAHLGDVIRSAEGSGMNERIEVSRLDRMFRLSLDLDPDDPGNHGRAAYFYYDQGNMGEAERCVARAFRLRRNDGDYALRLAEIYRDTDRPRDALAVLDLCLREGCDDAEVAWRAAIGALSNDQYESLLTYLDRYEALLPGQSWVGYYRAIGYLELGKPTEAFEALNLEEQRSPEEPFGVRVLRACAASALGQPERYRVHLEEALAIALSSIDYLTRSGLHSLSERLWKAGSCLAEDDPALSRLARRLLLAGLAPEPLFEKVRLASGVTRSSRFYRVELRQPLDERWADFEGRLDGQEDWTEYRCRWGVQAPDEESAGRMALAEQAKCYDLPASVEKIECNSDEDEEDAPGIYWQGARWQ